MSTLCCGIFPSLLILRTALKEGIADLREKPYLLPYIFAHLEHDTSVSKYVGTIQQASDWFLNTEIPVINVASFDKPKIPCITIALGSSSEADTTMGDIHYTPDEDNDLEWPTLVSFTPVSYSPVTGVFIPPPSLSEDFSIQPGMVVVDKQSEQYEIIDVDADGSFSIDPGVTADFSPVTIKASWPAYSATLESIVYQETYSIGIHASGEMAHLTWLSQIIQFVLLRYKESLLEGKGIERTTFSISEPQREELVDGQITLGQYISLKGFVRHMWPKYIGPRIASVQVQADAFDEETDELIAIDED